MARLCYHLFGALPAIRKRRDSKAMVISLASTTIVDFLVDKGLPRGNKLRAGLRIPPWILAKKEYRRACIRGLMDTDGCLYTHTHTVLGKRYVNIALCFCSASPMLIGQVAEIFEEFGIEPHIDISGRNVYLYSAKSVARYLETFGTSNERIRSKYEKWRDARAVEWATLER